MIKVDKGRVLYLYMFLLFVITFLIINLVLSVTVYTGVSLSYTRKKTSHLHALPVAVREVLAPRRQDLRAHGDDRAQEVPHRVVPGRSRHRTVRQVAEHVVELASLSLEQVIWGIGRQGIQEDCDSRCNP